MKITETRSSPNQSDRRGNIPRLICYHMTEGSFASALDWTMRSAAQVSYHFVVAEDGRIAQTVPLNRMAWAQGTTAADPPDNRHWSRSKLPLVKKLRGNVNQYSVGIGCAGRSGTPLPAAQLNALVWLTQHIQAEVRRLYNHTIPFDRRHLVGHFEINPRTKPGCPGRAFPWDELLTRLTDTQTRPAESAPAPPATNNLTHTVVAGDTLWALAERYLGNGNRWPEIQALNGGPTQCDPHSLRIGTKLKIPGGSS